MRWQNFIAPTVETTPRIGGEKFRSVATGHVQAFNLRGDATPSHQDLPRTAHLITCPHLPLSSASSLRYSTFSSSIVHVIYDWLGSVVWFGCMNFFSLLILFKFALLCNHSLGQFSLGFWIYDFNFGILCQ